MFYQEIESVFRRNLENRHMAGIHLPKMFANSVSLLKASQHVFICTGFIVKEVMAGETDGPPGALFLAKILESLGKEVILITDPWNKPLLEEGIDVLELNADLVIVNKDNGLDLAQQLFSENECMCLVGIERPSKSVDGRFYSMKGEDISPFVGDTDVLFHYCRLKGIPTIGIGDGGNEVGMGLIKQYVHQHVPLGEKICAVTSVDALIIGGVSNWVAYGLCGALSLEYGQHLLHTNEMEENLLSALIRKGAVDGFEKQAVMKVDGISLQDNLAVLEAIRAIINKYGQ